MGTFDTKDFKKLKKEWYDKLQNEGFDDIEDARSENEYLKNWHGSYFQSRYSASVFLERQSYFHMADSLLKQLTWEYDIWKDHISGLSIREIASKYEIKNWKVDHIVRNLRIRMTGHQMNDNLLTIRDAAPTDTNFIYSTWLKSLYNGNSWFREIPYCLYADNYRKIIDRILSKPSVQVKCLCLKEDHDCIVSYSVTENDPERGWVIHWVYTRTAWRKLGLAKKIVPEKTKEVTHLTQLAKKIKPPQWVFNPFDGGNPPKEFHHE